MTTAIEEARKMADDWFREWANCNGDRYELQQAFLAAIELGERREREAVAGWLHNPERGGPGLSPFALAYADQIERGDHRSLP